MNQRRAYLDARDYVLEHGFSARLNLEGYPRCFIGTLAAVVDGSVTPFINPGSPLREIFPDDCWADTFRLEEEQWTREDAAAAFEIAADLATPGPV
jgi:hypothetical protein